MKHHLLIILLLIYFSVNGQQPMASYFDQEIKPPVTIWAQFKTDSCFYFGGSSWDHYKYNPYVTKINGDGTIAWRYTDSFPGTTWTRALMACDSSVYGIACDNSISPVNVIFKLNANDGSLIWSQGFSGHINIFSIRLHNYGDSTIAMMSGRRFLLLEKSAGTILENLSLDTYNNADDDPTAIDPYGYLYCCGMDTIYKFDNVIHDSLIWKATYDIPNIRLENPRMLYADSNYLYTVGERSQSLGSPSGYPFLKIDPSDGTPVYRTGVPMPSQYVNELIDRNGFLFGVTSHRSVGSVNTSISGFKIEKQSGLLHWYINEDVDTLPNIPFPYPPFDHNISAKAIDIDENGDIFGTGHYFGNFLGTWFIYKLDGDSGNLLWNHTIIEDSSQYSSNGGGRIAWVHDDKVYFTGMIQPALPSYASFDVIGCVIECDTSNGTVMNKVYDGGSMKFESKVIDLERMPNGDIISFIQLGRGIQLIRSDSLLNTLWERKFYCLDYSPSDIIKAGRIAVAANGNIAFCGVNLTYQNYVDDEHIPDSIIYFQLDGSGNTISRTAFDMNVLATNPTYILDLVYDGTNAMLYYVDSNNIKCIDFDGGTIEENFLTLNNLNSWKAFKIGLDLDAQFTLYTSKTTAGLVLKKRYKTVLATSSIDTLSFINQRSTMANADAGRFLIGGTNVNGTILTMYDWVIKDTVWAYTGPGSSFESYTNILYDSATNSIYAVCRRMQNELTFERFNASTGQILWSTVYQHTGANASCSDLEYDSYNHRLIAVGYTDAFWIPSSTIWIFDSSGVALDTIIGSNIMPDEIDRISQNALNTSLIPTYNQVGATAALTINNQRTLIAASIAGIPVNQGALFDLSPSGIVTVTQSINHDQGIRIFPNPFSSGIHIRFDEALKSAQLLIYDLQGRLVITEQAPQNTLEHYIDLSHIKTGSYQLMIINDDKSRNNFKIIKN